MKDDAPAVVEARRALQKRLSDLYNLRLNRGTINRDKSVRTIQRISSFLMTAVGRIQLRQVTKRIKATSMSKLTKEAIVLAAAGRVGANIDAGTHMREALKLISRGAKASVTVVSYGITPQDLWDYLLPYVTVVNGVIYRGLIGGEIWLRSGDDNDPIRPRARRYVAAEEGIDWAPNASVVRAAHHPTIFSISSENFRNLLWWTSVENPVTQKLYRNLLECSSTGSSPAGKSASDAWRSAIEGVALVYPRFVEEIVVASLTLRSVSAIAISSPDVRMFCDALYTRVIALFSCEETRIHERAGVLELSRDTNGAVLVRQTGGKLDAYSGLPDLARRIEQYCIRNGLSVVQGFPTEDSDRKSPPDFAHGEIWAPSIAARWSERTRPISSVNARERSGIG